LKVVVIVTYITMKIILFRAAAVVSILGMTSTVHSRPIDSNSNSTTTINAGGLDIYDNEGSIGLPGWASGDFTRHRFGDTNIISPPMYPDSKFKFDNDIKDDTTTANRLGRARLSTSNNENDVVYDVVIVGAGAAGMGAARRLKLSGVNHVVILEATSGLGGRMQTDKNFTGYPLDLGPSYLPGQFFKRELEKIAGQSLSTTGEKWGGVWKNTSYNDIFTKFVAPELDIRYNCAVTKVNYKEKNNYTTIKCANGHTFLASYTIITASIQILKDEDIDFIPKIDPKLYNHREFLPGIKIFLEYDDKFYPRTPFAPLPPSYDRLGENLFWDGSVSAPGNPDNADNLLVGYLVGDRADDVCCSPDEIKNKVESILEKKFNRLPGSFNARRYLIAYNWRNKPYIKGAHSNVSKRANFNPPVVNPGGKNTLIIAGEAYPIPREGYAWVYSAFHSGFNAADQIMAIMSKRGFVVSPSCVDKEDKIKFVNWRKKTCAQIKNKTNKYCQREVRNQEGTLAENLCPTACSVGTCGGSEPDPSCKDKSGKIQVKVEKKKTCAQIKNKRKFCQLKVSNNKKDKKVADLCPAACSVDGCVQQ